MRHDPEINDTCGTSSIALPKISEPCFDDR